MGGVGVHVCTYICTIRKVILFFPRASIKNPIETTDHGEQGGEWMGGGEGGRLTFRGEKLQCPVQTYVLKNECK